MTNIIILSGVVAGVKYYNDKYNMITLDVKRTSGAVDRLPVRIRSDVDINAGDKITVKGELNTFDDKYSIDNKLKSFIRAENVDFSVLYPDVDNLFVCVGKIVKSPIFRITATGRRILQFVIANNTDRSNYIPCIVWGNNANIECQTGDYVRITGRFQSREYIKDNQVKTTHEVSGQTLEVLEVLTK